MIPMKYNYVPMNEKYADEIAYQWKYEDIYSFYDMTANEEDLIDFLDLKQWNYIFAVLNQSKELIGFYSFSFDYDVMWIGFGLNPEYTGKGHGSDFVMSGIKFGIKHYGYDGHYIMLSVAKFNERAIKTYKKIGFEIVEEYMHETNGDKHQFVKMRILL